MNQRKKQPALTRLAILDAANEEFSLHGYSEAGIAAIVTRAELTKGALFHHFPDKRSLAIAWISERLDEEIRQLWIAPLDSASSLDGLRDLCRLRSKEITPTDATSALVAIAAGMVSQDAVLAEATERVFVDWRSAIADLLERGKAAGWIHRSIKPETEAAFLVSAFAGFTVTAKASRSPEARISFITALEGYLETLRVQQA